MNERIKELAKQTGYIWHASGDPQVYEFTPEKLEKFAELIVRECMDVASPNYMSTPDHGVYYVEQAIDRIAEHFGVDE